MSEVMNVGVMNVGQSVILIISIIVSVIIIVIIVIVIIITSIIIIISLVASTITPLSGQAFRPLFGQCPNPRCMNCKGASLTEYRQCPTVRKEVVKMLCKLFDKRVHDSL